MSLAAVEPEEGQLFSLKPFTVRRPVLDLRQTTKIISDPEAEYLKERLGTEELVEFRVYANPGKLELDPAASSVTFVYSAVEIMVVLDD